MTDSTSNTDNTKLAKFNEYFSISHDFSLNVKQLPTQQHYNYSDFLALIPTPFMLATQVVAIDNIALQPLQTVSGVANQLAQYLTLQSQKIDLLMNYIISQQDEAAYRYQGVRFGGSGLNFIAETPMNINDNVELKLFLNIDNCNIYCHGEVIGIEKIDDSYHHQVLFHHIRDDDRELLVRCCLHTQQKQLQAKKRKDEP